MLSLDNRKLFICPRVVDMRKIFDGLSAIVVSEVAWLTPDGTTDKTAILKIFKKLYKIEKDAKTHCEKLKLDKDETIEHYYTERQNNSKTILQELKNKLQIKTEDSDEASGISVAKNYMLKRWEEFELYLTDGELPIDNNAAERQIKRVVIGRKNYLFVGSGDAGAWAANNYTIIESARFAKIDIRWYLKEITKAIIYDERKDYENLTQQKLQNLWIESKK